MKKLFFAIGALAIALVLAGCESGDDDDNTNSTTLKIKNESFTELTNVIWQDVSFANNHYENSIKTGTTVTQTVKENAGYIFFKRKSNPIFARTQELIIVGNKEKKEFTFTDNIVIVEANNTANAGTLGSLQSTVVFFDDAEGEVLPYYQKQSFVGYYSGSGTDGGYSYGNSGLPSGYSSWHSPKNGDKSIAIGNTITAKLHLKINLARRAKLSFWYANKHCYAPGTTFSVNGTTKLTLTTDIDWSFIEFQLESGQNDLVWAKKDGITNSGNRYYFSLDDILIYYTD